MKRTILAIITAAAFLLLPCTHGYAKETELEKILKGCTNYKDTEMAMLSSYVLSNLAEKENNPLLNDMKSIIVVNVKKGGTTYPGIKSDCEKVLSAKGFENMTMTVTESNGSTAIYTCTGQESDDEIVCINETSDRYSVIYIKGKISNRLMEALLRGEISLK